MRRSYRELWFEPEDVSKEIFLTGTKFHLNTSSASGIKQNFVSTASPKAETINVWPSIFMSKKKMWLHFSLSASISHLILSHMFGHNLTEKSGRIFKIAQCKMS